MATGQTDQPANPRPVARTAEPQARWGRPLAVATAVVFLVSSVFPLVAGLSRDTAAFPEWWGPLDVGIAFVLATLALLVLGITQGKVDPRAEEATYRAYRVLVHGILAMCVVLMLFGDHIILPHCLTGFAWRAWLLLYCLPAWFTAFRARPGVAPSL
jgi:hypothetical protein